MANTLIHENRRLQFPLDTLVDALIELENKQGHWPARATVVGASIDNSGDANAGVILSIHRPEGGDIIERRYSLPMLAAAIVNYCLTVRVPIPRNSTKSIQVLADSVALVLENTVMVQSRHEELSTLPAGSVHTVPTAPTTASTPPEEAVSPNEGAPPNGAGPPNEAAPPDQATPPSDPAPPNEAPKTSSEPAG
ncbi:MAG: hypothetical protein WBE91_11475 [Steroidobacteraceae bacterium]